MWPTRAVVVAAFGCCLLYIKLRTYELGFLADNKFTDFRLAGGGFGP